MADSTKGIIRTDVKDVLHICNIVERTLKRMIRVKVPRLGRVGKVSDEDRQNYKLPVLEIKPDLGMVDAEFTYEGELRSLKILFNCDNDENGKYPGKKLILSLGAWGNSVLIIREILSRMTHLGDCYLDENDCDAQPDIKVDAPSRTFIESCIDGFDYSLTFDTWHEVWRQAKSGKPAYQYLGITREEMEQIYLDNNAKFGIIERYTEAAKAAKALAAA